MARVLFSFDDTPAQFELSKRAQGFRVTIASGCDDWDFEDEDLARELTTEVRHCTTLEDALEVLGVDAR